MTVEYTEGFYTTTCEAPIGFYILFSPLLLPGVIIGFYFLSNQYVDHSSVMMQIMSYPLGEFNITLGELAGACFFSPVFSAFTAGLINLFETKFD